MAKKKKFYVPKQPPKDENKLVIPASLKVAIGHQPRPSGCGVHQDKRTRRQRTRSAQLKAALSY